MVLEMNNIKKSFGSLNVLKDISFSVVMLLVLRRLTMVWASFLDIGFFIYGPNMIGMSSKENRVQFIWKTSVIK